VHKGFYDKLFPGLETGTNRLHPYGEIIRTLKEKIENLGGSPDNKVPVWIAGHSLGAALASLFIARLLKSPEDLGDSYQLMDCYNFGCPALGDSSFAIASASNKNTPFDRYSEIWRIIDDADIVTRFPAANENINVLSRMGVDSFHNYAHFGVPIHLCWDGTDPTVYPQFYSTGIKVEMYTFDGPKKKVAILKKDKFHLVQGVVETFMHFLPVFWTSNYDPRKPASPTDWLGRLVIPKNFLDHFPHRYYESLEKVRVKILRQGPKVVGIPA